MAVKIVRTKHLPKPITKPILAYDFFGKLINIMQEEPARVDQGDWLRTGANATCIVGGDKWKTVAPACGTVGCTAGWAAVLLGYPTFKDSDQVAEDLGLNFIHQPIAGKLFGSSGYNLHVWAEPGTKAHMQQVVRGIREFMAEYKDVLKRVVVYPKGKIK